MSSVSTCPGLQDFAKYLLGQLPEQEQAAFTEHLVTCASCSAVIQKLQSGATVAAEKQEVSPPTVISTTPGRPASPIPLDNGRNSKTVPRISPTIIGGDVLSPSEHEYTFLAPAEEPDEMGRLGTYRVLKVLGAGGMGIVFKAEEIQLKRIVALKVMKPECSGSEKARQRFLREARAMASLDHDNIVRIYQVGEERGLPYLAMQMLHGETLCDRLERNGPLKVPQLLRVGREISTGLAAAHAIGVIHRDIKPDNIWLEEGTDRVKILDFGLARGGDDNHLTQTGTILGTPEYMSPEQAQGKPVDPRSDLFSLGGVLYDACTGRPPFRSTETMAILLAVISQTPTAISQYNQDLPEVVVALIMRLLAKHPEDRPADAASVAAAFKELEQYYGEAAVAAAAQKPRPPAESGSSTRLVVIGLLIGALSFAGYWFSNDIARFVRKMANKADIQLPKK
jgi:serine/threonine protein kinase